MKSTNNAEQSAAESVERRAGTKGNVGQQSTRRAQDRESVSQALERVRQAARQRKKEQFTSLLHHVDPAMLRTAFYALKRDAAPGVDGMTWEAYGRDLDRRIEDLHAQVKSGAYRALPSRRSYIPKKDGSKRPIYNFGAQPFDSYSSGANTFSVVRAQRELFGWATASAYYAYFTQDSAKYLSVSGNERRDSIDARFAAKINGFDGDLEVMVQTGSIGSDSIRAWAVGSLSGYTFAGIGWTPRLGFQFDAASGDSNPHDNVLQTFNPLFPNGYYFSLAGYTGYTNLIHVKPSIALHPTDSLTLTVAVAAQWRETTADAVYTQGNVPVPGTAGQAGRYTGTYGQLRFDWAINSHSSFAVEAVRFDVGNAIQRAGGHNSDYLGVQISNAW